MPFNDVNTESPTLACHTSRAGICAATSGDVMCFAAPTSATMSASRYPPGSDAVKKPGDRARLLWPSVTATDAGAPKPLPHPMAGLALPGGVRRCSPNGVPGVREKARYRPSGDHAGAPSQSTLGATYCTVRDATSYTVTKA